MHVDITGRHIDITEPIRKFVVDRLEKLRGTGDEILEVHVILSVEKHQRHLAEANVKTRHDFYHSAEESTDMYTSIAALTEKLEKQLRRVKDKTKARRKNGDSVGVVTSSKDEAEHHIGDNLPRVIRTHEVAAKPLSVDDAVLEIDGTHHEFLVFRNCDTQRLNVVYKRKDGNIGWIEPEA